MRRSSFATGFQFNYWKKGDKRKPKYRPDIDEAPFVKPKHDNLRDEILESGFLTKSKWMEFVDLKPMGQYLSEVDIL